MPSKKTASVKKRPGAKKRVGLTSALGPKATTFVVVCVIAGGLAIGTRQREYAKAKAATAETVMAADTTTPPPVGTKKSMTKSRPASTGSATPVSTSGTTAKPDATITGCLERSGDDFRLKRTEGEDAPKSRSWKSGFLKKGSTAITVVDPSRTLRLGNHVGRRVTVTGTLADRELRADAIHAVASSCKVN